MGYGVMRKGEFVVDRTRDSLDSPMMMSFIKSGIRFGKQTYLGFAECSSLPMLRSVYQSGQRAKLCFSRPPLKHAKDIFQEPDGWAVTIVPQLPGIECPGNITFVTTRPNGDQQELPVSQLPSIDMSMEPYWLFPLTQDLSFRRLLNGVNRLATDSESLLASIVQGNDLRETHPEPLIVNKTETDHAMDKMNPNQEEIFRKILESGHICQFVLGPSGAGKTTFIADMAAKFVEVGEQVTAVAPSNQATDVLATKLQRLYPNLGAIRFHSLNSENRKLENLTASSGGQRQMDTYENDALPENVMKSGLDESQAEAFVAFNNFLVQIMKDPSCPRSKTARPNFKSMSLAIRAAQMAGVSFDGLPIPEVFQMAEAQRDQYKELRQMMEGKIGNTSELKEKNDKPLHRDSS